jgi:hypothetical protein
MEYTLRSEDEYVFSYDYAKQSLEALLVADIVGIDHNPKNKHFLFQLGMLLAYNHYGKAAGFAEKRFVLREPIEPTPEKSYGNVILDFMKNGVAHQPAYILLNRGFLISPVREADPSTIEKGRAWKREMLKVSGITLHFPYDDTPQKGDPIGKRIVKDNLAAESQSQRVFIIYDPTSTGSVVDTGSYFMMKHALDKKFEQEWRTFNILESGKDSCYLSFLKEIESFDK